MLHLCLLENMEYWMQPLDAVASVTRIINGEEYYCVLH